MLLPPLRALTAPGRVRLCMGLSQAYARKPGWGSPWAEEAVPELVLVPGGLSDLPHAQGLPDSSGICVLLVGAKVPWVCALSMEPHHRPRVCPDPAPLHHPPTAGEGSAPAERFLRAEDRPHHGHPCAALPPLHLQKQEPGQMLLEVLLYQEGM